MNRELPKYVHQKHGSYYFVRHGKWTRIGKTLDQFDTVRAALHAVPAGKEDVYKYAVRLLPRVKANAKGRRRTFDLTHDNLLTLLNDCGWKCAVTNTPFSLEVIGPKRQRPFAPSIDRIDNAKGYSEDNCRVVCVAANFAMNTWGEGVLLKMARHAVRPSVLDMSNTNFRQQS